MSILLLLALASAPVEDAERRADRLRTQELNARAHGVVKRRDEANDRRLGAYREARERYERQRADWRRRVADCRAGDWDACDER